MSDGEPVAVLVETDEGVALQWAERDLTGLTVRYEGLEAARLAIETARGRTVRLTPVSYG
jgi:hypothetical protein